MAILTSDAFDEFHSKLLPTVAQKESMEYKREATHNYLLKAFPEGTNMPLWYTKLMGSAHRGTAIRPLDDIDVLAVFDDTYDVYEDTYCHDSSKFLERVRKGLDTIGINVVHGTRGQAIRLLYENGAHVDIAPVFREVRGHYLLPSGDGTWIATNPDKHAEWLIQKEAELSEHLLPLIRLIKRWNNEHSKHLKSYHLEVVIANTFSHVGANWRKTLANFFEWAPGFIDVDDPAGHGGNLADYLTTDRRNQLESRLQQAAQRAKLALEAEAEGNHEEAMRLWRIELGDEFPAYV